MAQGYVLTQYFYEQMLQFEKDPASLKDTIGEMVYGMDVDQQVHRARANSNSTRRADEDVLQRSKPRQSDGTGSGRGKAGQRRCADGRAPWRKKCSPNQTDTSSRRPMRRGPISSWRASDLLTGHPDEADRRLSEDHREQQGTAACSPGRTSISAACLIWNASATRPCH